MDHYYCLCIYEVPLQMQEEVSQSCFDMGASGVSEDLAFEQVNDEYLVETLNQQANTLMAYFESDPGAAGLTKFKQKFPKLKIHLSKEPNKDWMEQWKQGFTAFSLVDDIWVVPSWLKPPTEAKKCIWIDPGMAFGTGTHETTKIAAQLVVAVTKANGIESMLDVGTGSGILAILGHLLRIPRICATEIDEQARMVAVENVNKNQAGSVVVYDHQIEAIKDENFNLVVANIIDGVLIKIKPDLLRLLIGQAQLIVTGILEEREESFHKNFILSSQLKIVTRMQLGEWVGFVLEK